MDSPATCAVIAAWNCRDDVCALLDSLEALGEPQLRVILVDNGSTDGLAAAVAARFAGVRLHRLEENTGSAGGWATGVELALAEGFDYLWVLDADSRVRPGALAALHAVLAPRPHVGIVGSQICIASRPDLVQELGLSAHWWRGVNEQCHRGERVDPSRPPHPVDYVGGCSVLFRRQVIEVAGSLRRDLFVFYDDAEWCARARKCGFDVWVAPASLVEHRYYGLKPWTPFRLYYAWRNHLEWLWQHAPAPAVYLGLWRVLAGQQLRLAEYHWAGCHELAAAGAAAQADFLAGRFGPWRPTPGSEGSPAPGQVVEWASLRDATVRIDHPGRFEALAAFLDAWERHLGAHPLELVAPRLVAELVSPRPWLRTTIRPRSLLGRARLALQLSRRPATFGISLAPYHRGTGERALVAADGALRRDDRPRARVWRRAIEVGAALARGARQLQRLVSAPSRAPRPETRRVEER
jgi:hypothetical protein